MDSPPIPSYLPRGDGLRFADDKCFYLTMIVFAVVLVFYGSSFFSFFGIVLIADKVRKCPCCNQPINSTDYGKKVWEESDAK